MAKKLPPVHPDDELDDLSQEILRVEMMNAGISSPGIKKLLPGEVNVKTIQARRNKAMYKRHLFEHRKEALQVVKESEVAAVRELVALLKSKDSRTRLAAAAILSKGVIDQRREQLINQDADTGDKTIRIIFDKKPAILENTYLPNQPQEKPEELVIEVKQEKKPPKEKKDPFSNDSNNLERAPIEENDPDDEPFGMT